MPFAYYGAKHGLAHKYPRPRHDVIIEPFAGSAAYSVHHAAHIDYAVLIDADEKLIELWREVQAMTHVDVDLIGKQLDGERINHPLLAAMSGSTTMNAVLGGRTRQVTPRMRQDWPSVSARIKRTLPHIKNWRIIHGDYHDAPNLAATWFVDPPYQENGTMAGAGYRHPASAIDFDRLGDWCRTRRGFTIVCEQSPASWLPFHPFATQANGCGVGTVSRQEVVWLSDVEYLQLFDTSANPQDASAADGTQWPHSKPLMRTPPVAGVSCRSRRVRSHDSARHARPRMRAGWMLRRVRAPQQPTLLLR